MVEDAPDTSSDSVTWGQWWGIVAIVNVILLGLEYMVYRALAPVERGEPADTTVWTPVAIVYELFGFGAAMSVIPALWLCLTSIVAWETWKRFKRERQNRARCYVRSANIGCPR